MLTKQNAKIGIIGLGLIGGSLAKVLAENNFNIIGIARSDSTFQKAKELEIFYNVSQDIKCINDCDVIFVATPINSTQVVFENLSNTVKKPCIITDVASIKGEIEDLAVKIFDQELITFIGGHPMAGTEFKGIDNAFSELFDSCKWVLCPTNPLKSTQLKFLGSIISDTGANIIYSNPYTHDLAVAMISHLPLLISMSIVETVNSQEDLILKELAFYLAASGFRDTTRLAAGNPELSYEMIKFNEKNVLKAMNIFKNSLSKLIDHLSLPKEEPINKFEEIAKIRKSLYSQFGSNIFAGLSGE